MIPAPLPERETERLAALHDLRILDTPREEAYDALTQLAAYVCGSPIALVSLVDQNRQWFKSAYGLDVRETTRDVAFCAHAILTPEAPLLVPDAQADARFADNPLVTGEPHVRSYASVPLVWGNGEAVGTLCVIDRVPRQFSDEQLHALHSLGRQVISLFALRDTTRRLEAKVTALERTGRELERSETYYRNLVENAQGLICQHDLDGTLRMVNNAACRALGYSREELLGRKLSDFVPREHWDAYERYLHLIEQTGYFQGLMTLEGRTGRRVALAYQNFAYETTAGTQVLGHGIDITERVRIEQTNRRMARVLEATPDFVATFDSALRPTYLNRAAREMCGLAPDAQLTGMTVEALLAEPGAAEGLRALMADALVHGVQRDETVITSQAGRQTPVARQVLAQPMRDGGAEFYAVLARDISDRIRDEASIHASETRFRRVVESLQEALFETDLDGNWTYLNPAWTEITGFSTEESLGRRMADFVHEEDRELHRRRFEPLLRHEKDASRFDVRYRTRAGGMRWFEIHVRATEDGAGHRIGTTGTLRDITEQRELSDALMKASQEALAASRLKSEFVANMSHEVRTPINGVVGLTTLLLDSSLTLEQRDLAEGIRSSAEALLTIVNDVLDISKIEAGKLSIEPVSFVLRREIEQALEPVAVKAHKKGLALRLTCAPELPESVISDPTRIRQVLINLADNAIKFTHQGTVAINVAVTSREEARRLRFDVVDGGIGIPADKLDAIFDKFTQADNSTTRKYGGSGLGLAICKQLVELMNGHIGVTSEVGAGSTFWFELPLVEAARPKAVHPGDGTEAAPLRRGFTVLVAEDNTINQKVARRFLEKLGCTVEIVDNGEDAVANVRSRVYDVVFMDCQMPKMDGYEATRAIRRLPEHAQLPIIAMTAHAMRGDREKCLEAGMSDYLSKPLQPEALAAALARLAPPAPSREESAA